MVARVCWHFKALHPDEVWDMPLSVLKDFVKVIEEATSDG